MSRRILFNIGVLWAIFYAPWWFCLLLVVVGAFYFISYYEIFFAGLLFDLLYGTIDKISFMYSTLGFLVCLVCYFLIERIKKNLR